MDYFVIMALAAALGTWLVTALGAATVVFFKSPKEAKTEEHYDKA